MHVHHGADRLAGEELARALTAADLVITTYGWRPGTARRCARSSGTGWCCDEAQNIKNARHPAGPGGARPARRVTGSR